MPTYLPTIVILTAAVLAILVVLYRIYDSRVEQPKKLEDELREGLTDPDGRKYKADVMVLEPVRKAAAASSYEGNRVVIVRNFGKIPHKPYSMNELMGIEIFIDDKVVGRVSRNGPTKLLDDIGPMVHKVTMRLMFDDPADPDFELVIWDPHTDNLSARAEGPRAALVNARKWFYHVEAVLRRTVSAPAPKPAPTSGPPPAPAPLPLVAAVPVIPPPASAPPPAAPPSKSEGDVLNAPLIPYI